jgi:hypothetical protein
MSAHKEGAPRPNHGAPLDQQHFENAASILTARDLVKLRGGDWCGTHGMVPGPGHSEKDRSLKVWDFNGGIRVHSFAGDDWRECRAYLGLGDDRRAEAGEVKPRSLTPSRPPTRVRDLIRTSAPVHLVPDAVAYLQSRKLWPLPKDCTLRAHPAAAYWDAGDPPVLVGKFPALVAEVRDIAGDLVTAHVTYLNGGQKLADRTPRKLLSGTGGREGCAVRLVPEGRILAVAEGIETALAAIRVLRVPVWSCLSTGLLSAFKAPPGVDRLVIAADRDVPGLVAAWKLRARLDLPMELRVSLGADFSDDVS